MYGSREIEYLRHALLLEEIRFGEDGNNPRPYQNRKVMKTWHDKFCTVFRPNLAAVIEPFVTLIRKEVTRKKTTGVFSPGQHKALLEVVYLLKTAPVLHFPNFTRPSRVHVDPRDRGAGVFLAQKKAT